MKYWYYTLSGAIPGGMILILMILLIALAAWWYISVRNREIVRGRRLRISLWITTCWLGGYVLIRWLLPAPPMPIRLAVYPLQGERINYGEQLASEIEATIQTTHPRWSVGAYARIQRNLTPSSTIPDSLAHLRELLQLDWQICGTYRFTDTSKSHVAFDLKVIRSSNGKSQSIQAAGPVNDALRMVADEVTRITGVKHHTATPPMLSPLWRDALASGWKVTDSVQVKAAGLRMEQAYQLDSMNVAGFTGLLRYRLQHKYDTNDLARWQTAALRVLKYGESYSPLLYTIGEYLRRTGDLDRAASAFQLAHELSPTNPEIHYSLSYLDPGRGKTRFDTSPVQHAKRALQIDPGYELARIRALEFEQVVPQRGDYDDIVNAGLQINPYSIDLLLRKSYFQSWKESPSAGIATLNTVVALDSCNSTAFFNRGIFYLRQKDTLQARNDFLMSLRFHGSVENLYYLGIIYQNLAQWDSAIFYFSERYRRSKEATDQQATQHARARLVYLMQEHRSSK